MLNSSKACPDPKGGFHPDPQLLFPKRQGDTTDALNPFSPRHLSLYGQSTPSTPNSKNRRKVSVDQADRVGPGGPFSSGSAPSSARRKSFQVETVADLPTVERRKQQLRPPEFPQVDFEKQKAFKSKLEKVLSSKSVFLKSAAVSFKQFDKDLDGYLQFSEIQRLIGRLIVNLQLPPLDDRILYKILKRYDVAKKNSLNLKDFQTMYWELLHTIQDRFYPTRNVNVRRSSFVGQHVIPKGQTIDRFFVFEKPLGAGTFGEVFLVREKTSNFQRVCKVINKDISKIPIEQIEAEIDVLKKLDHPHVIKVFEVYSDYNSIYIIMEICDGGELADRISSAYDSGYILTEKFVANTMKQLLEATNYFHSVRVAHKDIKPENILFQSKAADSPIKVIDFGLAEMFARQTEFSQNAAGTYLYMAPEVLDYIVTLKCDIWSCGCVMFQLLSGEVPFPGTTLEEVEYKLRHYDPPYEKLKDLPISKAAIDLLHHMLDRDLTNRYSAQECLDHYWLTNIRHSNVELPQEIATNLKRFKKQSNLKNALTNLLAHQLNVTGSQIKQINVVFKALDVDGNGTLSKEELASGLARVGFPGHEITQIINAVDVDGSDSVSYTEFLAACYTWRESELNVVWAAFTKMDLDGDGKITVDEFRKCLEGTHRKSKIIQNTEELTKLIREVDKNNDGIIQWDEFLHFMKS